MRPLLSLLLLAACSGDERDLFGAAVALAHDANDDGLRDLWIADPGLIRAKGEGTAGTVWLVCAKSGNSLLEISPPKEARCFGWTIAAVQDVDGDGVDELAVSAQYLSTTSGPPPAYREVNHAPQGEGGVYLFSGANGELLRSWRGPADTLKMSWYTSGAGPALTGVGDWNNDGRGDLAIGWCYATGDETEQGCVRVVSGADGALLHEFWGAEAHDRFGFALASMGEANEDGARTLAASAIPDYAGETEGAHENLGQIRPGYVRAFAPTGETLFDMRSPEKSRRFGYSLTWIPPLAEAAGRLAVSQSFYCEHGPAVHFLAASNGERLGGFERPPIGNWDGGWAAANVHPPDEQVNQSFGARVIPLGDLDGDGLIDVAVTAPQSFCTYPAAVLSSATGKVLQRIRLDESFGLYPPSGFQSHVGIAATPTDDCNGDGISDYAIGGASIRCSPGSCAGIVALYSGKDASTLRWFSRRKL